MGKVGSKSIYQAIRRAMNDDDDVFHTHYFGLAHLHAMTSKPKEPPKHVRDVRVLIDRLFEGRPLRVVTLVRDPIARNVSTFLAQLDSQMTEDASLTTKPLDELAAGFTDFHQHDRPVIWWDEHLCEPMRFDVFDETFDTGRRWQTYKSPSRPGDRRLLVLRTEMSDEHKSGVISEFLDLTDPIEIRRINTTEGKPHGDLLKRVAGELRFDEHYVDGLYSSDRVRHFFSAEEIDTLRKKWLG
jgi:hypothetical protein